MLENYLYENLSNKEIELVDIAYSNKLYFDNQYKDDYVSINTMLASSEYDKLIDFLCLPNFIKNINELNDMCTIYYAGQIYKSEIIAGINDTIFHGRTNIDQIIDYITHLRFFIWRIMYTDSPYALLNLNDYINSEHTSAVLLDHVVQACVIDYSDFSNRISLLSQGGHVNE